MEQSTQIQSKPSSSFSNSPKFLGGFLSRSMLDHPVISASPTSILDTKQFCNNNNNNKGNSTNHPIGYHHKDSVKPSSTEIKHKGIGLALEEDEDSDSFSKPNRKMVLFGAKLKKVQVPEPEIVVGPFPRSNNPSDLVDLKSPSDFGIKTKNLQLLHFDSSVKSQNRFREGLSLSEMELSEEYTCVMTHGNDPKIIHIFDDTIVETCCGGNLFDGLKIKEEEEEDGLKAKGNNGNSVELVDFLGFCYTCKVKLGVDKDIYMYRGEKSFCSPECRFQEIIREEDEDN